MNQSSLTPWSVAATMTVFEIYNSDTRSASGGDHLNGGLREVQLRPSKPSSDWTQDPNTVGGSGSRQTPQGEPRGRSAAPAVQSFTAVVE